MAVGTEIAFLEEKSDDRWEELRTKRMIFLMAGNSRKPVAEEILGKKESML